MTFLSSLVMLIPSGSDVLCGFVELSQTMNGPFNGALVMPTVTIANVFAVSRLKDTDWPHHCRDTECYLVHSVFILPVVPYCNWMPSAFDMVA